MQAIRLALIALGLVVSLAILASCSSPKDNTGNLIYDYGTTTTRTEPVTATVTTTAPTATR